ncbi:PREDICTED: protein PCF11-like [Nanorana parkeri]|uniref:protein PCF11-like n=1 Tax=Nanorana parkeri TaxID=125878 RepID=UPI000854EE97|nr:PREDICTED: protein PCF11-like [Nanorana parkeri]
MAADEPREDACREYQSSLEDLTFNSKPHINMLTILAEENLKFAKDIVTLIEAQVAKVFMTKAFYFTLRVPRSLILPPSGTAVGPGAPLRIETPPSSVQSGRYLTGQDGGKMSSL